MQTHVLRVHKCENEWDLYRDYAMETYFDNVATS